MTYTVSIIAYSHCMGTGSGQAQGMVQALMGSSILYRNVHTGLRTGQEPEPIASYCDGLVPCTCSRSCSLAAKNFDVLGEKARISEVLCLQCE